MDVSGLASSALNRLNCLEPTHRRGHRASPYKFWVAALVATCHAQKKVDAGPRRRRSTRTCWHKAACKAINGADFHAPDKKSATKPRFHKNDKITLGRMPTFLHSKLQVVEEASITDIVISRVKGTLTTISSNNCP